MYFGTKEIFKSVLAAEIAALLAWSVLKRGDRIGGLLIKEKSYFVPASRTISHIIKFLKQLVSVVNDKTESVQSYQSAFLPLKKAIKSGSELYFIGDFYHDQSGLQNELVYFSHYHHVTNLFVYDLIEKQLPKNGRYLFSKNFSSTPSFENQESLLLDTHHKKICKTYSEYFEQREQQIKHFSFSHKMHFAKFATDERVVDRFNSIMPRPLRK